MTKHYTAADWIGSIIGWAIVVLLLGSMATAVGSFVMDIIQPTSYQQEPYDPGDGGWGGDPDWEMGVDGDGYRVQCEDGSWSNSGGKQGACSWHGGVAD